MQYSVSEKSSWIEAHSADDGQDGSEWTLSLLGLMCLLSLAIFSMILGLLLLYDNSTEQSTTSRSLDEGSSNGSPDLLLPEIPVPRSFPPLVPKKPFSSTSPVTASPTREVITSSEPVMKPDTRNRSATSSPFPEDPVCNTTDCHFVAQWLRTKLEFNADPCTDFNQYVCARFRGPETNVFKMVTVVMKSMTISAAYAAHIPVRDQSPWQKAAGMFQACVSLAESNRSETRDLVAWMTSLNLDLSNPTKLATVDPMDMIMRCSLDFDVPAIFSLKFDAHILKDRKRMMELEYSKEDEEWQKKRLRIPPKDNLFDYAYLLSFYGLNSSTSRSLASEIIKYDKQLRDTVLRTIRPVFKIEPVPIPDMALKTSPYVTTDKWVAMFAKYTNNTYGEHDLISYKGYVLDILVKLFETMGEEGLRYLVAWSVYRQMIRYTEPTILVRNDNVSNACYNHVAKVMKLALLKPYLTSVVNQRTILKAATLVENIRVALRKALQSSSWLVGTVREVALRKLDKLVPFIGSPGGRLNDTFLQLYYEAVPDVSDGIFWSSWRKALSVSRHHTWADQKTWFFDETVLNAFYQFSFNKMIISAAILQPPFFFANGLAAFNYGALGMILGHEMMHGYDVIGRLFDDENEKKPWVTSQFTDTYTEKAQCLRGSHNTAKRMLARQAAVNEYSDSENVCDFVGTKTAYAAYDSLPAPQRRLKLPGINMTAAQLFFVAHCTKWCEHNHPISYLYAPGRSRCIVPLMNMAEFADAFACSRGTPMNPTKKCDFW